VLPLIPSSACSLGATTSARLSSSTRANRSATNTSANRRIHASHAGMGRDEHGWSNPSNTRVQGHCLRLQAIVFLSEG